MNLNYPIRILMAEENPFQIECYEEILERAGLEYAGRRVETKEGFIEAAEDFNPDVVIADMELAGFNALDVLKTTRSRFPGLPVIVVSGTAGEDTAILAFKEGAADYLMKSRINGLSYSVKKVFEESFKKKNERAYEENIRRNEELLRSFLNAVPEEAFLIDTDGAILVVNESFAARLQMRNEELAGLRIYDFLPAAAAVELKKNIDMAVFLSNPVSFESRRIGRALRFFVYPVFDKEKKVSRVAVLSYDVTDSKKAAAAEKLGKEAAVAAPASD